MLLPHLLLLIFYHDRNQFICDRELWSHNKSSNSKFHAGGKCQNIAHNVYSKELLAYYTSSIGNFHYVIFYPLRRKFSYSIGYNII